MIDFELIRRRLERARTELKALAHGHAFRPNLPGSDEGSANIIDAALGDVERLIQEVENRTVPKAGIAALLELFNLFTRLKITDGSVELIGKYGQIFKDTIVLRSVTRVPSTPEVDLLKSTMEKLFPGIPFVVKWVGGVETHFPIAKPILPCDTCTRADCILNAPHRKREPFGSTWIPYFVPFF